MMVIQFTLQDLMILLVCVIGIAAGILLLQVLWNIKKISDIIRPLLESNQELIKTTIRTIPEISENMAQSSSNIREITEQLKTSVPVILQEVAYVTNTAKGSIGLAGIVMENMGSGINETIAAYKKDSPDLMAYLHIFKEVWQIISRTFASGK